MTDVKLAALNDQGPTHEALVVILHPGEKHERIVVCKHLNRFRTGPKIDLEMLQGE